MTRVVRIHQYGDASVLEIEDIEVSAPADGEVQIAVKAIGLNRAEVMFRNHAYLQLATFPSRLGYEAAGIVQGVGATVSGFKPGDLVSVIPALDIARGGTYGELVNVPARLVVKHPVTLSFDAAAAVWMQYVTAWGALVEQAKLSAGDTVIVTAASSSVGLAAFQVARMMGATIVATTRTRAKRQALLDAGAHHVVAIEEEDLVEKVMAVTGGRGARVVFDAVGGPSFERLTASIARGGILIQYGALSPEPTPFPLFAVLAKSVTVKGYLYSEIVSDDTILNRVRAGIVDGLTSGALKPKIARTFTLDQIQEAHRYLESNEQIGKVIVRV
ncbi:zinc-dependent alcohol dehydrogenase family protein [Variovorax sp. J2P1-59]|uniref:zinc-dependent alcohol dehydrogenase family protein n=1 Tax=Variovorax flavidus TaxID=3053501 RepID=UPI002574C1D9|nr:zinc-dependent alcohol dehydrogenase family protein [Variovorax sp. J2P1-59]MDM0078146.1 zinc-dependent alcohol dehydrogenase family protein [Variovorax sp. J2P1-59]